MSDVPEGETVEQRNLVLQFGEEFVTHCMESFPEWGQVEALLTASRRGVLFGAQTSAAIRPLFLELLAARGLRRLVLFMSMLEVLVGAEDTELLASPATRPTLRGSLRRASIMRCRTSARISRRSYASRTWRNWRVRV